MILEEYFLIEVVFHFIVADKEIDLADIRLSIKSDEQFWINPYKRQHDLTSQYKNFLLVDKHI